MGFPMWHIPTSPDMKAYPHSYKQSTSKNLFMKKRKRDRGKNIHQTHPPFWTCPGNMQQWQPKRTVKQSTNKPGLLIYSLLPLISLSEVFLFLLHIHSGFLFFLFRSLCVNAFRHDFIPASVKHDRSLAPSYQITVDQTYNLLFKTT